MRSSHNLNHKGHEGHKGATYLTFVPFVVRKSSIPRGENWGLAGFL
jgi:hypothetical protein